MKIRTSYVSNSSSSSFICEICGEKDFSQSGELEDCEEIKMVCPGCQETHFHVMCVDHVPEDGHCPICAMEVLSLCDADAYLKVPEITDEIVLSWIKETNKRRRKTRDGDYAYYVLSKSGKNLDDVLEEIRLKFKTYLDFKKFISHKAWS